MADYRTSIDIAAPPEVVFAHLITPERMITWMGERAELEARPGGMFAVDVTGNPFRGEYLEVQPPHRVVVSWGLAGSDSFPPGSMRRPPGAAAAPGGRLMGPGGQRFFSTWLVSGRVHADTN